IIVAATYYGGVGAGWAWLGVNSLYVIFWVGYVHSKLEPGLHFMWLVKDCLAIYLPVIVLLSLLFIWPLNSSNRWIVLIFISAISLTAISSAILSSGIMRNKILLKIKSFT